MDNYQLDYGLTKEILKQYDIDAMGELVTTKAKVLEITAQIKRPAVLKIVSPEVIHKTDFNAVKLNLRTEQEVSKAYDEIMENALNAGVKQITGVLIQEMASPGFELLIGAKQDVCYGPVTMVGTGGRFVELWEDAFPGVGVLRKEDVLHMLSQTRANRVLDGFRGPRLDKEKVVELAIKVSKMMSENPDIVELDLNPVIVYENNLSIVDARIIKGDPIIPPRAEDIDLKRLKSLDAIFSPKSIVLFGANRTGTVGGTIMRNMIDFPVFYPMNPKVPQLFGKKCFSQLEEIPDDIDLGIFAIGAEKSVTAFKQFVNKGGKGAVIVGDGFAEVGRDDLEQEIKNIADGSHVNYIGPNCLGIIDNFSGVNTMFIPERKTSFIEKPGGIGIISQSGGIGLELLEMLAGDNIPVGRWVSCGNSSGVSIPELLNHMKEDARIKVIALYLEGLKDGLQFIEVGKEISKEKPVIVIKGGVGGGAAATMSHTASLAGSFQAFKAACDQAGFFLIEELTEDPKILVNILSILATQPRARGNRVGIITVGGGAGILLADQITQAGMQLAGFSDLSMHQLSELLIDKFHVSSEEKKKIVLEMISSNPLDLFGDCDDRRLVEAIKILDSDPQVDVILLALYFQVPGLSEYINDYLIDLSEMISKPLILAPRGYSEYVWQNRNYLRRKGISSYTVPVIESLSMAIKIWEKYDVDKNNIQI
jgi:3-hydroxypropionyl-CoA synthetase (ADP-forming)